MPQLTIVKSEPLPAAQAGPLAIVKSEPSAPAPMQAGMIPAPSEGPVMDFIGEATKGINPKNLYHAAKSIVMDLPGTIGNIGAAQGAVYDKAKASFEDGDYPSALRHGLNWLMPLIGPRVDQAGDFMARGEMAKGLGAVADIGLQASLPGAAGKVSASTRGILRGTANPAEAAAVRFGQAQGVPIDAGTVTGSQFVKSVQKSVGSRVGGANTAEAMQRGQATALQRVSEKLAGRANATRAGNVGAPQTPVSAGEAVSGRLDSRIKAQARIADTSYDALRALEQQQAARIAQTGGVRAPATSAKPFTNVPLAVDVAAAKQSLTPLFDQLSRERDLVGVIQGGKARTLVALDSLMKGPDVVPLSVADAALSGLKSMARTKDLQTLRTPGQGAAAAAVKALEQEVTATATAAGPDAIGALQKGRLATVGKYETAAVRETLSSEPGQIYRQLTTGRDVNLNRLRAVAQQTPREIPKIARAYLEDQFDLATREGSFAHADKLYADWRKLGAETKTVLFKDPALVQDLDNFFLLAKRIGQNPNPSGTASVLTSGRLTLAELVAVIPSWGLAKMLYTQRGVHALTAGLKITATTSPVARSLAVAQIVRAAREAGVPVAVPATEEQGPVR